LALAHTNTVDPARTLLSELETAWDGTSRLDGWLSKVCHLPEDAYHRAVGKNIIGGMVRRIRNPGCKHDTISIFHGPQGTGKSTLASVLALRSEWFTDSIMFGTESKELVLSLAGKAVVEVSEMGMRGSTNANHIKAMISRQVDEGRTAYARSVAKRPRRNIFIGTTNSDTPLEDPSGNRRFLPVSVQRHLDLDWLAQHVRQLIGEAAALETKRADFQLPVEVWGEAAERQEAVRAESDVEVRLEEWFTATEYTKAAHITAADLSQLMGLAGLRNSHSTRSGVMQALGFRRDFGMAEGKKVRVWLRGAFEAAMQCRYAVGVDAHGQARVTLQGGMATSAPSYPVPQPSGAG
jgi:predicted P-loop ATPase